MGPVARSLAWDGCFNVRDLGGLETTSGHRTRHGAVVRADNVRRLTEAGWQAALAHGIRRVVDLRFADESPGEADAHAGVEVVSVSLFGQHDPEEALAFEKRLFAADDVGSAFAAEYIRTLERAPQTVAAAIAAVADADDDHGVLIHCFAGKDRTGIVTALLLDAVDVLDEAIVADYAASHANLGGVFDPWVARARDDEERETRLRSALSPAETVEAVLAWLGDAGGSRAYLADAGLTSDQLGRLERRLVTP
ncbi:tyrosine-protein phosphatase [Gaiella sp.]|uniref:tyrosine-protein phosphatase n=1 Tax=Gaiella sp. TaxID=2663207 RepID=UPI003263343E